jgi:hypothetical protein
LGKRLIWNLVVGYLKNTCYLPVMFVSIKLLLVIFPGDIGNGTRGCEIFVPFSRNTVALVGVFDIVVFVGLTPNTELAAPTTRNKAKMPPEITNWHFILKSRSYR